MRKIMFYISILTTTAIVSCKRDEVKLPDFDVTTEKVTYKAGETIKFNISGNPDNIVFWPGTAGRKYEFRNRLVESGAKLFVDFNSFQQFFVQGGLTIMVSNNYNGVADATNLNAATWVDITNRFVLSNGADQTPSGKVDLTEFTAGNKPVYFAYRYVTTQLRAQTRWVIRTFNADKQSVDGTVTNLANIGTAGWQQVSLANPAAVWSIQAVQLLCVGTTTALDDDWVFTKALNITAASPDQGLPIKNTTTSLSSYTTSYSTPGTYKLTFVATNASYQNQESTLKEITLTITP